VVIPLKRRVTKQTARKGASQTGFAPLANAALLRTLRIIFNLGPALDAAHAAHLRPVATETRLMDITETASLPNILFCLLFPFDKRNETDATQRQLLEMIVAPQDHRQLLGAGRTDRHDQPAARRELFEQLPR